MSRYEEIQEAIASQNKQGGMDYQKWVTFMLTDIALSLATIADAIKREDGEKNDC